MNGNLHYREAESLLNQAARESLKGNDPSHALAAAQVHATLALAAANGIEEEPTTPERRPRTRLTDNHLIGVANVYTDADDAGGAPTRAVANRFGVPHSTAAKWVGRARERRFLPPAGGEDL